MTSIVTFVTDRTAVIAADQAIWGPDGRVTAFESKLVLVERAHSVVAAQGIFSQQLFRLVVVASRDLPDLHERIARFVKSNADRLASDSDWEGVNHDGQMAVWGASWFEDAPVIWGTPSTTPDQPFEIMNLGSLYVSPKVDWSAALGRTVETREDVASLAPADALAIMEAQRRYTDETLGLGPLHCAGGGCDVAVVGADAVNLGTLQLWPDRIGERISA